MIELLKILSFITMPFLFYFLFKFNRKSLKITFFYGFLLYLYYYYCEFFIEKYTHSVFNDLSADTVLDHPFFFFSIFFWFLTFAYPYKLGDKYKIIFKLGWILVFIKTIDSMFDIGMKSQYILLNIIGYGSIYFPFVILSLFSLLFFYGASPKKYRHEKACFGAILTHVIVIALCISYRCYTLTEHRIVGILVGIALALVIYYPSDKIYKSLDRKLLD